MFEKLRGVMIEEPKNFHNPIYDYRKVDLYETYKQGWWITEIFGSKATMVRLSQSATKRLKKPHFVSVQSHIDVSQITPDVQKVIDKIREKKWNKYKKYLLGQDDER